jgi:ribosomal protein L17
MGNQLSSLFNSNEIETTKLKPASVREIIDYIATYYILTMDFQSLRKLYDIEYCDKLVILTSDIIERYFTDLQITYLAENIKNGEKINEMEKDKIIFFDKDEILNLDIKNSVKKRRVCISIAKFYIKIAHVFASILTTINPVYIYKDEDGNTVKTDIYNRSKIPKEANVEILKLNICDSRIDALKRDANVDFSNNLSDDTEIKIHPKMCSFNLKLQKNDENDENDDLKNLEDEPGIPELMELYYDDYYDYDTGKFRGMKEETQNLFNENLQNFYRVFVDNQGEPMPENIKKFSDIKLRDYNKKPKCSGINPPYKNAVKGTIKDDLFKQYAENLKQMMKKANTNQELLLDVLNKLFVYMTDPQTNKKIIRINPKLTEESLQEAVLEARAIIINLYLTCETDFANGIKIYEAIVDKKIIDTAKSQIETMERTSEKLITEDTVPLPAELNKLKEIADKKKENENKVAQEEDAVEEDAVEEDAVKEDAVKEDAVEEDAVKEDAVEEELIKEQNQPVPRVANVNIQGLGDDIIMPVLNPIVNENKPALGGKTHKGLKSINKKTKKQKNNKYIRRI